MLIVLNYFFIQNTNKQFSLSGVFTVLTLFFVLINFNTWFPFVPVDSFRRKKRVRESEISKSIVFVEFQMKT